MLGERKRPDNNQPEQHSQHPARASGRVDGGARRKRVRARAFFS